jgi:hypothetical protein
MGRESNSKIFINNLEFAFELLLKGISDYHRWQSCTELFHFDLPVKFCCKISKTEELSTI